MARLDILSNSDVSVILQGAVTDDTSNIIQQLRHILPNAEIILSTWIGQEVSMCQADRVVFSADPGCFVQNRKIKGNGRFNNVNRQIVSSFEGLKVATRKYALKTRTDIFIEKNEWMNFFGKYDEEAPPTLFKSRVLICNYYSRNPRIFSLPFHWGDWVFFGETNDLIDVFNIPLMENDDAFWFDVNKRKNNLFSDNVNRYVPEQWILSSFLRKHICLDFGCFYDATPENIKTTETFFAENTVVLDLEQWGINFVKYNPNRHRDSFTLLHSRDWHILYKRYAEKKAGVFWIKYRLRLFLCRVLHFRIRSKVVKLFSILGVKETLRRLLNRE